VGSVRSGLSADTPCRFPGLSADVGAFLHATAWHLGRFPDATGQWARVNGREGARGTGKCSKRTVPSCTWSSKLLHACRHGHNDLPVGEGQARTGLSCLGGRIACEIIGDQKKSKALRREGKF
jgi:hypothetical protein